MQVLIQPKNKAEGTSGQCQHQGTQPPNRTLSAGSQENCEPHSTQATDRASVSAGRQNGVRPHEV